jgi:3-methylcrotonyl-CoA carboxylase beta subunit
VQAADVLPECPPLKQQSVDILLTVRHSEFCVQVEKEKRGAKGRPWSADEEAAFKAGITSKYESEGQPLFSSARLWDDGIVDPADSRRVLGLALGAALHAKREGSRYGVFRM